MPINIIMKQKQIKVLQNLLWRREIFRAERTKEPIIHNFIGLGIRIIAPFTKVQLHHTSLCPSRDTWDLLSIVESGAISYRSHLFWASCETSCRPSFSATSRLMLLNGSSKKRFSPKLAKWWELLMIYWGITIRGLTISALMMIMLVHIFVNRTSAYVYIHVPGNTCRMHHCMP